MVRGIAQLVEQRIPNPQVVGSSPTAPATLIRLESRNVRESEDLSARFEEGIA